MATLFKRTRSIDSKQHAVLRKPVNDSSKAGDKSSRPPSSAVAEPPRTSHSVRKPADRDPPPLPQNMAPAHGHARHDSVTANSTTTTPKRTSSLKGVLNAYYKIFGGHPPKKPPRNEMPAEEVERLRRTVRKYERQLEEASNTLLLQDKVLAKWEKQGWHAKKEDVQDQSQPPLAPGTDSPTPTAELDGLETEKTLKSEFSKNSTATPPEGRLTTLQESSKEMLNELTAGEKFPDIENISIAGEKPDSINRSLEAAERTAKERSEESAALKDATAKEQAEEYAALKKATTEALEATKEVKRQLESEVELLRAELEIAKAAAVAPPMTQDIASRELDGSAGINKELQAKIEELEAQLAEAKAAVETHANELSAHKSSSAKELGLAVEASQASSAEAETLRKELKDIKSSHQEAQLTLESVRSELSEKSGLVSTHEASLAQRDLDHTSLLATHEDALTNTKKEIDVANEKIAQLTADVEKANADHLEAKTALEAAHADAEKLREISTGESKEELDALTKDLETAQVQVAKLTSDSESIQAEHAEAKSALEAAQVEIGELKALVETLNASELALKDQLALLQEELQTARSSNESSSQDTETRLAELTALTEKHQLTQSELETARSQSEKLKKDLESHTAAEANLASAQARLTELQTELDQHTTSKAGLERDLEAHVSHKTELQREIDEHVSSKTELESKLEALSVVKGEHELAQARILELTSGSDDHAATKTELVSAHNRIEELTKDLDDHVLTQSELESAKVRLEELSQQLEDQFSSNSELESKIAVLEKEVESHTATKTELDAAHAQIVELSEQASKGTDATAELEAARVRVDELSKELESHANLRGDLDAAQMQIRDLSTHAEAHAAEKAEHEATRTKVLDLSKEIECHEAAKSELETSRLRLVELEKDVEAGKADHTSIQERLAEVEAAFAAATRDHKSLAQSVTAKDKELEELQTDFQDITREISIKSSALKEAEEALQKAKDSAAEMEVLSVKSKEAEEKLAAAEEAQKVAQEKHDSVESTLTEKVAELQKLNEHNHQLTQDLQATKKSETTVKAAYYKLQNEFENLHHDHTSLKSRFEPEQEKHKSHLTEAVLAGGAAVAGAFGIAKAVEHHEEKESSKDAEDEGKETETSAPSEDFEKISAPAAADDTSPEEADISREIADDAGVDSPLVEADRAPEHVNHTIQTPSLKDVPGDVGEKSATDVDATSDPIIASAENPNVTEEPQTDNQPTGEELPTLEETNLDLKTSLAIDENSKGSHSNIGDSSTSSVNAATTELDSVNPKPNIVQLETIEKSDLEPETDVPTEAMDVGESQKPALELADESANERTQREVIEQPQDVTSLVDEHSAPDISIQDTTEEPAVEPVQTEATNNVHTAVPVDDSEMTFDEPVQRSIDTEGIKEASEVPHESVQSDQLDAQIPESSEPTEAPENQAEHASVSVSPQETDLTEKNDSSPTELPNEIESEDSFDLAVEAKEADEEPRLNEASSPIATTDELDDQPQEMIFENDPVPTVPSAHSKQVLDSIVELPKTNNAQSEIDFTRLPEESNDEQKETSALHPGIHSKESPELATGPIEDGEQIKEPETITAPNPMVDDETSDLSAERNEIAEHMVTTETSPDTEQISTSSDPEAVELELAPPVESNPIDTIEDEEVANELEHTKLDERTIGSVGLQKAEHDVLASKPDTTHEDRISHASSVDLHNADQPSSDEPIAAFTESDTGTVEDTAVSDESTRDLSATAPGESDVEVHPDVNVLHPENDRPHDESTRIVLHESNPEILVAESVQSEQNLNETTVSGDTETPLEASQEALLLNNPPHHLQEDLQPEVRHEGESENKTTDAARDEEMDDESIPYTHPEGLSGEKSQIDKSMATAGAEQTPEFDNAKEVEHETRAVDHVVDKYLENKPVDEAELLGQTDGTEQPPPQQVLDHESEPEMPLSGEKSEDIEEHVQEEADEEPTAPFTGLIASKDLDEQPEHQKTAATGDAISSNADTSLPSSTLKPRSSRLPDDSDNSRTFAHTKEEYSPMPSSPEYSPLPSPSGSPSKRKSVRWEDLEKPEQQSPAVEKSVSFVKPEPESDGAEIEKGAVTPVPKSTLEDSTTHQEREHHGDPIDDEEPAHPTSKIGVADGPSDSGDPEHLSAPQEEVSAKSIEPLMVEEKIEELEPKSAIESDLKQEEGSVVKDNAKEDEEDDAMSLAEKAAMLLGHIKNSDNPVESRDKCHASRSEAI